MATDGRASKPQDTSTRSSPTDYLANERTFLAWTRSGVALIALGFVVARFGLLLRELGSRSAASQQQSILGGHASSLFGTAIVLVAAVMLALSYLRYRRNARALDSGTFADTRLLTTGLAVSTIGVAVLLAIYLLLTS